MRKHLKNKGFTLIELLIAIVIVGILSAIGIPAYQEYVKKGRRADGRAAMLAVQLAQESFRVNCQQYATALDPLDAIDEPICNPAGPTFQLHLSDDSPEGHYVITLENVGTTSYDIIATPQGDQATDKCGELSVTVVGGSEDPDSRDQTGDAPTSVCWPG